MADFSYQYNQSWEGVVFSVDSDGLASIGLHPAAYPSTQRLVKLVREHLLKSHSSREPFLHVLDLFYKRTREDCAQRPTHELVLDFIRDYHPRVNLTWSEATGISTQGGSSWKSGYGHDGSLAEIVKKDVVHLRCGLAHAYQQSQSEPHGLTAPQFGYLIVAQLLRELTLSLAVHLYGQEALDTIIHIQKQADSTARKCSSCGHDHTDLEWATGQLVERTLLGGELQLEWRKEHQGDIRNIAGLNLKVGGTDYDLCGAHAAHAHEVLTSLYSTNIKVFKSVQKDIPDNVSVHSHASRHSGRVQEKASLIKKGEIVRTHATDALHHKSSPPNILTIMSTTTTSYEVRELEQHGGGGHMTPTAGHFLGASHPHGLNGNLGQSIGLNGNVHYRDASGSF